MAVLLLGATGFIGPRVLDALDAFGVEVVGASRRGGGRHGQALDRRDVEQVRTLVRKRRIDTVVDLLPYVEADTVPLLDALAGDVGRWVMVSSCDVYRNYEGLIRKAAPEPIVEPLAERSPLRDTRYPLRQQPRRPATAEDAFLDDYDKIPLEQALRSRAGLAAVVLRLPLVFGPGDRQRRFRWIVEPMLARNARLAVDSGLAGWRATYGYVDDVAHAIATAAGHPAAAGRTFNIGQPDASDHRAWVSAFAESLGWRGEVDTAAAPKENPVAALDFRYPLATDTHAFRVACGWREPTPLHEALARTAADERRRG